MGNIEQARPRGAMLVLLLAAGCSYDWTVAPEPDGLGAPPRADASVSDASTQAAEDASSPRSEAGRSCRDVQADLPAARAAAKACPTLTAPCTANVVDECGCRSYVWASSAAAGAAYESLLTEFRDLGCAASECNCMADVPGRCLAAGGGVYACSP